MPVQTNNFCMCQNLVAAYENRQRVATREAILGYLQQEQMREGWAQGELPPVILQLGALPQAHATPYYRYHPFARYCNENN